jgi:hypothetical protein
VGLKEPKRVSLSAKHLEPSRASAKDLMMAWRSEVLMAFPMATALVLSMASPKGTMWGCPSATPKERGLGGRLVPLTVVVMAFDSAPL